MLADIAKPWNLEKISLIAIHPHTQIFSAVQNHQPVILKVTKDASQEAMILELYNGHGAIEVLDKNDEALLLERAIPGYSLAKYFPHREQEAIKITCTLIQQLHKAPIPSGTNLPHLRDVLTVLDGASVPYIEKARILRDKLLATTITDVLLHGDLHHHNILKHSNSWVVIDPKGLIGDAAYEIACFVRNPIPELLQTNNATEIIHTRIKAFAQMLNIDEQRITEWCFVGAMLSHIWAIEDGIDPDYFSKIVDIFYNIVNL